jgi:Zn-dependent alcohol dehydrogenase
MKTQAAIAWQAGAPLERINDGFELMKQGESIRSVVLY